jgi:pilus assembly protein CpaE
MARQTTQAAVEDLSPEGIVAPGELIAPAPRVSVQAFCETAETAAAIQAAGEDRRLAKAHLRIEMGGLPAAVEAFQTSPTPNVVMLERASVRFAARSS